MYLIVSTATGEMYVGSSTDVRRRWRQHRNLLRRGANPCARLQAAWTAYPERFSFAVLRECAENDLHALEQQYIDSLKPALNSDPKAGSSIGRRMTAEQRLQLRGRPQSSAVHRDFRGEKRTVPEIATILGVTPAAIYSRLRAGGAVEPRTTNNFSNPVDVGGGRSLTPRAIAEEFALPLTTVYSRLRRGWTGEALTCPRKHRGRHSKG